MASIPPALEQLLGQSVQRGQYQNPLFQAASNQAFAGLPDYAKGGLSMPTGMQPVDLSGMGGGGSGANTASALGALSPAILAALLKAFKGTTTAGANPTGDVGPKYPGAGGGPGSGGSGGTETGGMGDFGNTSFDSNATTYNDKTQWDYILRMLLGMDPGSGGANASNDAGATGNKMVAPSAGLFGGGPKAR